MKRKQLAVRVNEDEHKKIKKMLIDADINFQDYVMSLVRKDMIEKGIK